MLSSASGAYQAAYDSFARSYGDKVPTLRLPERRPESDAPARVIVTFGSEAATRDYAVKATVIGCLAPGVAGRLPHKGRSVLIAMKPSPALLLERLRALQPGLKRLALLSDGRDGDFDTALRDAGAGLGIDIVALRVSSPQGIPDALRRLPGKVDALWLSPDPLLVTPDTFQTIKNFSWDHSIPFYAPASSLAEAGAAASVSVSGEEAGHQAARLARLALDGKALPTLVYPARVQLTVNLPSAVKSGLSIPAAALEQADKVIR